MSDFTNWMPETVPVPTEEAGSVTLDLAGPVAAGSYQRFTLTYKAGFYGIDDSGSIKICFRFASDMGKPQFQDPAAANFVSASASNGAILETTFDMKGNTRPWDRTLRVKVVAGFLREGDTISVAFGTDPRGPGVRMQTFVDPGFAFRVLSDPVATYTFVEVPNSPLLPVIPGKAASWHLVLPTLRAKGDVVALQIRAEDAWGNPTPVHDGAKLRLVGDGPLAGLPAEVAMPAGEIALRIEGLRAAAEGVCGVTAYDAAGEILARANTLTIREPRDGRAYWGDLHAQSGETIGSGSATDYLRYARDYAFLDAIGHQGNDFQITQEFWGLLNELMGEWNAPGRFVTVPGYEWSGNTALGGDRNVFFETEDRTIRRSSHALVPDRSDIATDCPDARALFAALTPERATTVMWAHCGGRYADIRYAHDAWLERSVEVHSSWGTFEWLVADAFDLGYRVGIVGNSDGHKGRPGSEPPGASLFGALGGLTCYLLPELTRPALFDAMRARHHYATTGCRLHLSTVATWEGEGIGWLDDPRDADARSTGPTSRAIMGDIVRLDAGSATLDIEVDAAVPILSLEIRRGREVIETIRPNAHLPAGKRVRLEWSGAEYRGRARQTVWDGSVQVTGADIVAAQAINFFNPDRPLKRPDAHTVAWQSITTGNFAGVDLHLSGPDAMLRFVTPLGTIERRLDELGPEPLVLPCGGLAREMRLSRLADRLDTRSLRLSRTVALGAGDNPLHVCVTLEDGHQAWSSPIYLLRGT